MKKLTLSLETLRVLSHLDAGRVGGGARKSTGPCTVTWLGCPLPSDMSDCELKCWP